MKNFVVQVDNISLISKNKKVILDNISFNITKNEILTIIGSNGAGKTSLIKTILGLTKPTTGQIIKDKNLVIGYVPQKIHIDESLPLTAKRFLKLSRYYSKNNLASVSKELKICKLLNQQMYNLSGGETQRILIARALLGKPELIVFDEPTQGVDMEGQKELYDLIFRLNSSLNSSVILISHDLNLIAKYTNKILYLNKDIKYYGTIDELKKSNKLNHLI